MVLLVGTGGIAASGRGMHAAADAAHSATDGALQ
ncbi:hypothetical protein BSFP_057870 [Burkholderia stabilis]|uniref:Uncharacterized protein n=1 Tax=Burkholderia stabilis TaxID=95485 RepID=A0A1Y1BXA3_9BURK|nr:hypothetical protein BSFP_057870 [Burkholderia stabilis]